jgi:hypothetical protein
MNKNPNERAPGGEEELKDIDLSPIAGWIEKYNKDFGSFARQIRAGVLLTPEEREKQEIESEDEEEPGEKEEARARSTQEQILREISELAEQVGLSIHFPSGDEEQEWALELRVHIVDGEKFTRYLRSQTENDPTDSQLEGLAKIADTLGKQLTEGYDLSDGNNPEFLELVGSLGEITEVYTRLGEKNPKVTESATILAGIYEAVRGRHLHEYIWVKEARLLTPIATGFGPSTWHTDSSQEGYERNWNEALETLAKVRKNPKAKDFAEKLRAHLLESLEYAEKDMKNRGNRLMNNKMEGFISSIKGKLQ